MSIRQVFVASLCIFLKLQQISAVVNNGIRPEIESTIVNSTNSASHNISSTNVNIVSNAISDSIAESSEQELNRREAPFILSNAYGSPPQVYKDSYLLQTPSNLGLPLPVYGVPNAPTNNIIYPAPPPDIPPPAISPVSAYGPPKEVKTIPLKYGLPHSYQGHSKPFIFPSINVPKPIYGPPPNFGHLPRPEYGLPQKPFYIPPKLLKPAYSPPLKLSNTYHRPQKPLYLPSKPSNAYGPPIKLLNLPNDVYGPPQGSQGLFNGLVEPTFPVQYGSLPPIPHGPPRPGAPAPPTPPDIKYDGWHPIPGLISRPPTGQLHHVNDLHLNNDFVPPPVGNHGSTFENKHNGLKDSYGAPLNTVTGSGGIISSSGNDHRNFGQSSGSSSLGIASSSYNAHSSNEHDNGGLSVVKSIGYQIFPTPINNGGFGNNGYITNSYNSPPLNSYSSNGPYAAAHTYNLNDINSLPEINNFASSLVSSFEETLSSNSNHYAQDLNNNIGLIPPSGVYGIPSSSNYGTSLLNGILDSSKVGVHQPKRPVKFRDPVPAGLIESIGKAVAQKDAQGIITDDSYNLVGPAYIPPPVPDITKPVKEDQPENPTTLYSLPSKNPVSFQNYLQGSTTTNLNHGYSNFYNLNGATSAALTSYNRPIKSGGESYGLPQSSGLAIGLTSPQASHAAFGVTQNFASTLSNGYGAPYFGSYQNSGYDCASHMSQPLPSLSFGVPAANSYSASLASLNTNIAGAHQNPLPHLNYGVPDLQPAYSQTSKNTYSPNSNNLMQDQKLEASGKALAENFGTTSELIKSHSIDLSNIPVQGNLGSYSLQIQSADGTRGSTGVPHHQVLNDGLLQSILNAIEQPRQNTAAILGQPLLHLQQIPSQPQQYGNGQYEFVEDSEAQNSVTKSSVLIAPLNQKLTSIPQEPINDRNSGLSSIDDNEVAVYFNNNANNQNIQETLNNNQINNTTGLSNGQQYGSYVSFRNNNSSFAYGNLEMAKLTLKDDLELKS